MSGPRLPCAGHSALSGNVGPCPLPAVFQVEMTHTAVARLRAVGVPRPRHRLGACGRHVSWVLRGVLTNPQDRAYVSMINNDTDRGRVLADQDQQQG